MPIKEDTKDLVKVAFGCLGLIVFGLLIFIATSAALVAIVKHV